MALRLEKALSRCQRQAVEDKANLVKLMNRRFDNDLKPHLFEIWRLRFRLAQALKPKRRLRTHAAADFTVELDLASLYEAYLHLRTMIVSFLFEIYIKSKNTAYHHKKESYLIFKANLQRYLADGGLVLTMLLKVFLRLARRDHSRFLRSGPAAKPDLFGLAEVSQMHFER